MITRFFFLIGTLLMLNQQASAECCSAGNCPINTEWDMWKGECISCPCSEGCPCENALRSNAKRRAK